MKKQLFAAVLTALLALPFAGQAFQIDHFLDVPGPPIALTDYVTGGLAPSQNELANDAIGGNRLVQIQKQGGPGGALDGVQASTGASALRFSASADSWGYMKLTYDWNMVQQDHSGFPPTVFDGIGVAVNMLGADHISSMTMVLADALGNWSIGTEVNPAQPDLIFFPYAGMVPAVGSPGPVNLNLVIAAQFTLLGQVSGDYTLGQIYTTDRLPDAGGTMTLLTIAVGLLGLARWRMKA